MIIYRLCGTAERFKDCGRIMIAPIVGTNLSEVNKKATRFRDEANENGLSYDLRLQKLEIKKIGKKEIVQLFRDEEPGGLIESLEQVVRYKKL